jgi:hypothetical protein
LQEGTDFDPVTYGKETYKAAQPWFGLVFEFQTKPRWVKKFQNLTKPIQTMVEPF